MSNPPENGRFKPGQSGNPGGRPRAAKEIRALAQAMVPEAMQRLAEIMRKGEDRIAVTAAMAILERAGGRPMTELDPLQRKKLKAEIKRLEEGKDLEGQTITVVIPERKVDPDAGG